MIRNIKCKNFAFGCDCDIISFNFIFIIHCSMYGAKACTVSNKSNLFTKLNTTDPFIHYSMQKKSEHSANICTIFSIYLMKWSFVNEIHWLNWERCADIHISIHNLDHLYSHAKQTKTKPKTRGRRQKQHQIMNILNEINISLDIQFDWITYGPHMMWFKKIYIMFWVLI